MSDQDIVIIVDENDKVLEYKPRFKLTPADRHRIAAVWIENSQGKILIAKRVATKIVDPSCWGPAAVGTVVKGESYAQNIKRELAEELGVDRVQLKPLKKQVYDSNRGHKRVCQWFSLTLDWPEEKFKLQADEVAAVRWIGKPTLVREIEQHPETYVASAVMWPYLFNLKD